MKTRSSKTKVSYACLFPSPTLSYTITKQKRRTFCNAKVIEVPEAPVGSLKVLFSFHSNKFLFRFFSDRVLLSVLSDRDTILMVLNDGPLWVPSDRLFFRVLSNRFLSVVIIALFPACSAIFYQHVLLLFVGIILSKRTSHNQYRKIEEILA